jgi:hypothetical protein
MQYFGYGRFLVGCARATNQTSKVENQIRKSLGLLILTAFRNPCFEVRKFHWSDYKLQGLRVCPILAAEHEF